MKRINNETILDTLYDLADANGLRIDKLMELIEEEFGEQPIDTEGLPEQVVNELNLARAAKKEQSKQQRIAKDNEKMASDVQRFRELFPDVSADDIPEAVWEEVANGVSLAHAYALYEIGQARIDSRAREINERNRNGSAAAFGDGATEPVFTKEEVEKMSGKDVRLNYKNIINAMKNWRF